MATATAALCSSVTSFRPTWAIRETKCISSSRTAPFSALSLSSLSAQRAGAQEDSQRQVKASAWFKFGKNGMDSEGAGIYGSQKREDFDRDDVEQYFNYMGMLATEGTYDKMEALLSTGIQAVDILLLLAASEGDLPKIEELLRAGADCTVKDDQGRTALDRAQDEDVKKLILGKTTLKV